MQNFEWIHLIGGLRLEKRAVELLSTTALSHTCDEQIAPQQALISGVLSRIFCRFTRFRAKVDKSYHRVSRMSVKDITKAMSERKLLQGSKAPQTGHGDCSAGKFP